MDEKIEWHKVKGRYKYKALLNKVEVEHISCNLLTLVGGVGLKKTEICSEKVVLYIKIMWSGHLFDILKPSKNICHYFYFSKESYIIYVQPWFKKFKQWNIEVHKESIFNWIHQSQTKLVSITWEEYQHLLVPLKIIQFSISCKNNR